MFELQVLGRKLFDCTTFHCFQAPVECSNYNCVHWRQSSSNLWTVWIHPPTPMHVGQYRVRSFSLQIPLVLGLKPSWRCQSRVWVLTLGLRSQESFKWYPLIYIRILLHLEFFLIQSIFTFQSLNQFSAFIYVTMTTSSTRFMYMYNMYCK